VVRGRLPMNIFRWVAAAIFFLQLPNPIFWLVVHPQISYWRGRLRAAYITALVSSWGVVRILQIVFRRAIFAERHSGDLRIGLGLLLIAADIWLFERARQDLGTSRLIGKTELAGGGEVVDTGIYSYLRNPRYVGMIASVLGACLLAATALMWAICGVWLALVLMVIGFEERELRARLGAPYIEYCRRVPRFIPYRMPVRAK
ncbi:MAG: isoprenylcysteine carboxylmethyltransferase family protein, partial [Candidatus Acidiferrales bacterium]